MNNYIKNLSDNFSVKKIFDDEPVFKFRNELTHCPVCDKKLSVYSTEPNKQVITLHVGKFKAHHTLLSCNCQNKPKIYHSEILSNLVPKYSNYGYDIIEYTGRAVFQRFRTEIEVMNELKSLNIFISASEIGYLSKKFILYLSVLHKKCSTQISESMQKQGGYILHTDGTTEGGSPHLISALDGISEFVLANTKIPTENADDIAQKLLKGIKKRFGVPLAVVTDLGKAMLNAVSEVFPFVLIFVCHFHFLRDIGKDLLKTSYDRIRNKLKKYGISAKLNYRLKYYLKSIENLETSFEQVTQDEKIYTNLDKTQLSTICYTLIQWAFDAKKSGNAYGFPFDIPHVNFYKRLCCVYETLKKIETFQNNKKSNNVKTVKYLLNDLEEIVNDTALKETVCKFLQRRNVFEALRKAMRIAEPNSKKGLNDKGEDENIKTIEQRTIKFREDLTNSPDYENEKLYHKMIEQIDKYWDKLFADPIIINTQNGKKTVQPQRTNNILEQFFRAFKKNHRRTSGNNSIAKKLQTMFADTALVKNLNNSEYMKIILSDKQTLAQRFAELDYEIIKKEYQKEKKYQNKIPIKIKKLIKKQNVSNLFVNLQSKSS